MTYAPTTFLEAEAGLNVVTTDVAGIKASVATAIARINEADVRMGNVVQAAPVGWLDLVTYVNTQATANGSDQAWQDLKRRKDKIVADVTSIQNKIQEYIDAINAVT